MWTKCMYKVCFFIINLLLIFSASCLGTSYHISPHTSYFILHIYLSSINIYLSFSFFSLFLFLFFLYLFSSLSSFFFSSFSSSFSFSFCFTLFLPQIDWWFFKKKNKKTRTYLSQAHTNTHTTLLLTWGGTLLNMYKCWNFVCMYAC